MLSWPTHLPASNVGAGFKEGAGGARKKCRHCDATYETMQECFQKKSSLCDVKKIVKNS